MGDAALTHNARVSESRPGGLLGDVALRLLRNMQRNHSCTCHSLEESHGLQASIRIYFCRLEGSVADYSSFEGAAAFILNVTPEGDAVSRLNGFELSVAKQHGSERPGEPGPGI